MGDSALGLAAASYLFKNFKNPEGDLAKIKSIVVSEKALAPVAKKLGMDRMLELGKGEEKSGGRSKRAILADCVEAVLGAVYVDSGYEKAEEFALSFLRASIEAAAGQKTQDDSKSRLQKIYQRMSKHCPVYEVVDVSGPDHERSFKVSVRLGEKVYGTASGRSKKEAEQNAAKAACDAIEKAGGGK